MKQIAILGTAPSVHLAPVGAESGWEIWACSPGTMGIPRIDRFFELHRWQPGVSWFPPEYVKFLEEFNGPVYMTTDVPTVKNCTRLPVQQLVDKYGPYFFTSSIAWMIALAIEEGAEKIGLWGVDMAAATEYKDQRLGCQYMCAIARSKGIEVGVPPESDLLRPAPLYGVCEQTHGWIKQTQRNQYLVTRAQECQADIDKLTKELNYLNGCLDEQDWTLQSFFGGMDHIENRHLEPLDIPALRRMEFSNTPADPGIIQFDEAAGD